MARYSPVAPIQLLEEMFERKVLGDYLLLLAHDVLKEPHRYENLMLKIPDAFIIMDNSVVELGEALPAYDVIEAACVVEASCIMTPDSLGGMNETIALVEDQAEELQEAGFPLMKVPQGDGFNELAECVTWLEDYLPSDGVSYWGVPRWIANKMYSRSDIIEFIKRNVSKPKIHLLGMSDHWHDDTDCARRDKVMGIDSANPVVVGQRVRTQFMRTKEHVDRGDYWTHTKLTPEAVANIEFTRAAISDT